MATTIASPMPIDFSAGRGSTTLRSGNVEARLTACSIVACCICGESGVGWRMNPTALRSRSSNSGNTFSIRPATSVSGNAERNGAAM